MTLSFALTAVMTVALLVAVLAVMWEGQFQQYTRQNMVRLATNTASTIASRYQEEGGWNEKVLNAAIVATNSSSDVGVQVLNADGTVLYDETWPQGASTNTDDLLDGTTENASLAPTSTDSVVSAPIVVDGQTVGSVRVWAFGSDALLTKSDAAFRANSYGVIAGAAGAAILLACIMGVFVSRSLTRPLKRITTTARAIRNGDLTARTGLSGDDEIGELGQMFDEMATTIERDMKTEHRLTSDVAHELRTPLMAMLVNVEAMQDGVLPADEEHLGVVASEVRRLSRLVDAMLALSRMENGTTPVNLEPTEMVELVAHLASMQKPLFADQGLTLSCHIDLSSPEVYSYVDRDLVKQALVNLLSNALRYTPEGGSVSIIISEDSKDVLVSVADTGIGIAKEDLGNVFSRFWRSDASRERVSGGLGVGLALTKEIVQKMNGIISVESELGVGTTFTLHLPKVKTNSLGSTGSIPRISAN
jgi:signal transduction histidine kinase